jgi:hypothetical protein
LGLRLLPLFEAGAMPGLCAARRSSARQVLTQIPEIFMTCDL